MERKPLLAGRAQSSAGTENEEISENHRGESNSGGPGAELGPQARAALESLVAYLSVLLIGLLSAATAPL